MHTPCPATAPHAEPLLCLENVTVTLQGVKAVNDVSLSIYRGKHLLLLGPNGAGKTTLLKLLRGEVRPDQRDGGLIFWYDEGEKSTSALSGRRLCSIISPHLHNMYMGQEWDLDGEEIIIAGLTDDYFLYHAPTEEQKDIAAQLAGLLGASHLLHKKLKTFSQGQLRLVLLMRALARKPEILLLDEAADGLDAESRTLFLNALEKIVCQNTQKNQEVQSDSPTEKNCPVLPTFAGWAPTIIMSTHRDMPSFMKEYANMEKGCLSGPHTVSQTALAKGHTLYPPALQPLAVPPAELPKNSPEELQPKKVQSKELQKDNQTPPATGETNGLELYLEDVTVFIDRVKILKDIHWKVGKHENWLILGANGSGKSTLLRTLINLEDIALGGKYTRQLDGSPLVLLEEVNRHVRMVSDRLQALYSYDNTARQVIFTGFDGSIGVYREPTPEEDQAVDHLLALTDMTPWQDRPFHNLSTGQARRILLARALVGAPRLLLLDEPFSGLDAATRSLIISILEKETARGLQIILTSHHSEDTLPCIGRVAQLTDGHMEIIC